MFYKKIRQTVKHIIRLDLSGYYNRRRLPGVFVDNGQGLDRPPVLCPIQDKIIGPDMVAMRRPEPYTGAVIEPLSSPFGLFLRDL